MKTCPICHAGAFDDALVCYGCLHRFDAEPSGSALGLTGAIPALSEPDNAGLIRGAAPDQAVLRAEGANFPAGAALVISVQAVPGAEPGIEWRCDVDGRTLSVPCPS